MKWSQVAHVFEMRIAHLLPARKEKEQKGFELFETFLKEKMPQAIENPLLLRDADSSAMYESLKDVKHGNTIFNAYKKVVAAINHVGEPAKLREGITADEQIFTKEEVAYCSVMWLEQQGWATMGAIYAATDLADRIMAEKNGNKLVGMVIGSAKQRILEKVESSHAAIHRFKERLGKILLSLMEELNANPQVITAIFIADDLPTRQLIIQYAAYIKRMGIKIYMVKSVMLVEEI